MACRAPYVGRRWEESEAYEVNRSVLISSLQSPTRLEAHLNVMVGYSYTAWCECHIPDFNVDHIRVLTHAEHWSLHPKGTLAASISTWEAVVEEVMMLMWFKNRVACKDRAGGQGSRVGIWQLIRDGSQALKRSVERCMHWVRNQSFVIGPGANRKKPRVIRMYVRGRWPPPCSPPAEAVPEEEEWLFVNK